MTTTETTIVDPKLSQRDPFNSAWLETQHAAEFANVSRTSLYAWLKHGLHGIQLRRRYVGRRVFIAVDDLAEFLQLTSAKSGARRPRTAREATTLVADANVEHVEHEQTEAAQ